MSLVVFIEPDEVNIERIRAILDGAEIPFEYRLFSSPEQAIDLIGDEKPEVFACSMELPVISGEEMFSAVGLISEDTVQIVMTDLTDIPAAVAFINRCGAYQMIVKPCRVAEDITIPVNAALALWQKRKQHKEKRPGGDMDSVRLLKECEAAEHAFAAEEAHLRQIQRVFVSMLADNLNFGRKSPTIHKKLKSWYEWMADAYRREVLCGPGSGREAVDFLRQAYHHPEAGCSFAFQIKPREAVVAPFQMNEILFVTHLMAGACKLALNRYRIHVLVEAKPEAYVLRFGCAFPASGGQGEIWRESDGLFLREISGAIRSCVDALGHRSAMQQHQEEVSASVVFPRPQRKSN